MTDLPAYHISDSLRERGGDYELVVFHRDIVTWLDAQIFYKRGNPYLECLSSGQDRRAYPSPFFHSSLSSCLRLHTIARRSPLRYNVDVPMWD